MPPHGLHSGTTTRRHADDRRRLGHRRRPAQPGRNPIHRRNGRRMNHAPDLDTDFDHYETPSRAHTEPSHPARVHRRADALGYNGWPDIVRGQIADVYIDAARLAMTEPAAVAQIGRILDDRFDMARRTCRLGPDQRNADSLSAANLARTAFHRRSTW